MSHMFVISVLAFPSIIGAMMLTKYAINSPQSGVDIVPCGSFSGSYSYCGARVDNVSCVPLTTDWCASAQIMSSGNVYLVKKMVIERFEDTLVSEYYRQIPIYLSEGSKLEFRFKLHSGWDSYGIDLKDDSENIVLHIKLRSPDDFFFNSKVNGTWASSEGYANSFSISVGAIYTLKIVCATNGFQIDLDGAYPWTFLYPLPAQTIRSIRSFFHGAQGDLYQVTYKAGP